MRFLRDKLALSPLVVFLCIYLISSLVCKDFYSIPISSAFLIASIYAVVIFSDKPLEERVSVFSKGAGNGNVLLMIWIFVLAGAFASTAEDIGAIDATVNLCLKLLPGNLIYAGLFIASCFISLSIGTSVGTIVALVPIAAGISEQFCLGGASGFLTSTPFITAIIVGGAFFGDNLSFISDTTIAATRTQGCSMADKFKVNIWIAGPPAIIVCILYILVGSSVEYIHSDIKLELMKLIPYVLVIILALSGINVIGVLSTGIAANAIIGFITDSMTWASFLTSIGEGISGMGDLIIVTMLAGGMLELIRVNGGLDLIINFMTRRIKGKRGAEFSIAGLVSLANLCTANNTIAIITIGEIAKDISQRYNLNSKKTASLLDTFSCMIQGIIPYGAQMLMASGLAGVSAISLTSYLYYPFLLGIFAIMAIIFRFPRKYS